MTVPPLGEHTPAGIPPKVCRGCGRSGEWPGQPCPACKLPAEIRALLARLELVSHAPIQAYAFAPSEVGRGQRNRTSDRKPPIPHLGSHRPNTGDTKTPQGTDVERRPRAPKSPRIEGDARSGKLWDEFEEELASWKACYHRRTVGYFQRRLSRAVSDGEMRQIREELEKTIKSWRVMEIPPGQPPALGDPQWKRWVAESSLQTGEIARTFSVSRQYVQRVRKAYREAA